MAGPFIQKNDEAYRCTIPEEAARPISGGQPDVTLAGATLAQGQPWRGLAGASLVGATLEQPWRGQPWHKGNLAGATLPEATLTGATLAGATLAGATLTGATLAGATLASEKNPTLAGATLAGAAWRGRNSFLGPTSPARVARRGFRVNPLLHCALWLAGMHQVWQARSAWQSKQISKR